MGNPLIDYLGEVINEHSKLFRFGYGLSYRASYLAREKRPPDKSVRPPRKTKGTIEPYIQYLTWLRRSARVTQKEVADKLRSKQPVISRFESGGISPSLTFLRRYAKAIGIEIAIVVTDKREKLQKS